MTQVRPAAHTARRLPRRAHDTGSPIACQSTRGHGIVTRPPCHCNISIRGAVRRRPYTAAAKPLHTRTAEHGRAGAPAASARRLGRASPHSAGPKIQIPDPPFSSHHHALTHPAPPRPAHQPHHQPHQAASAGCRTLPRPISRPSSRASAATSPLSRPSRARPWRLTSRPLSRAPRASRRSPLAASSSACRSSRSPSPASRTWCVQRHGPRPPRRRTPPFSSPPINPSITHSLIHSLAPPPPGTHPPPNPTGQPPVASRGVDPLERRPPLPYGQDLHQLGPDPHRHEPFQVAPHLR